MKLKIRSKRLEWRVEVDNILKKIVRINIAKIIMMACVFSLTTTATVTLFPKRAEAVACCDSCCSCIGSTVGTDFTEWLINDFGGMALYFGIEFFMVRNIWYDQTLWQRNILPAMIQMGSQLAAVGTHQVAAIGMFLDAQQQLETQRLLQQLHAQATKDYQPSEGLCEFGTRMKSLASTERKGEANALILSDRSNDRLLGNKGTVTLGGSVDDTRIRFDQFQTTYCDTYDNNGSFKFICPDLAPDGDPDQAQMARFNRDVDYQKTIQDPWTIGFDFTMGGDPASADQDVIAMANNLYGYDSFVRVGSIGLKNRDDDSITGLQQSYLGMRAAVAKTKVAENSFNALMAMKGEGSVGSRDFIVSYLEELGLPTAEIDEFLGENPSYYAQMEILTKKAYQSPMFYTNLYDTPTNVARKGVAIQAIGLIQKFDLLKSYLRTEASLSILLELSVQQLQRQVEDNISAIQDTKAIIRRQ